MRNADNSSFKKIIPYKYGSNIPPSIINVVYTEILPILTIQIPKIADTTEITALQAAILTPYAVMRNANKFNNKKRKTETAATSTGKTNK